MKTQKYYLPIGILIVGILNTVFVSCGNENAGKKEKPITASPAPSPDKADETNPEKTVNQKFIAAVLDDNLELVKKYLDDGIDPNISDDPDYVIRSGLHWAASGGKIEMIRLLLKYGADINRPDIYNVKPIHLAVSAGHSKAVEFLLDAGADINAVDIQARTPLAYAVMDADYQIAELLLKRGADCGIKSITGYGPPSGEEQSNYDLAMENNDGMMIVLLSKYCGIKQK